MNIDYKYVGHNLYYRDQISNNGDYMIRRKFEFHLAKEYGISGKQYVNLIRTGAISGDISSIELSTAEWKLINSNVLDIYNNRNNLKCQLNPGEILRNYDWGYKCIINQLEDHITTPIRSTDFSKYLLNDYALLPQEYYNLIIFGDINYIPKCPYCGTPLRFQSLQRGYRKECDSDECKRLGFSDRAKTMWSGFDMDTRDHIITKLHESGLTLESQLNAAYNKFMNAGNEDDECYFYLAIYQEDKDYYIKLGVSQNVEVRKNYMKYNTIHIIVTSNRYIIANIEYYVKLELKVFNEYLIYTKSNFKSLKDAIKKSVNRMKLDPKWI